MATKSKVIKLSLEVINLLNRRRARMNNTSYDAALRYYFGLPSRKGEEHNLATYYVLPNEGEPLIFKTKAEARGAAVIRAVRKGHKRAEAVITVRGNVA